MRLFKRLFGKKEPTITVKSVHENAVYMATLGIPLEKIIKYKESVKTIKEFESRF